MQFNTMYLFAYFADGAVMPSWFDLHELPITAVSYAYFLPPETLPFFILLVYYYLLRDLPISWIGFACQWVHWVGK